MDDGYETWRAALAGQAPPIHVDKPQAGFWTQRYMGIRTPVAIYPHNGRLVAMVDVGEAARTVDPKEVWADCCRSPLTYEAYEHVRSTGQWPDVPAVAEPAAAGSGEPPFPVGADEALPPRNHNEPTEKDAAISARLDDLHRLVEPTARAVVDQATADRATNLKDQILSLRNEAEEARKQEKKPWDDGAKAVQAKWLPLIERAAVAAAPLTRSIGAWMTAERTKREAEAAAAVAAGAPPAAAAPRKVRAGGAVSGRATSLRTQAVAEVEDWSALLAALANHPDIRAAAQSIANASARSGIALPGTKISNREVAV